MFAAVTYAFDPTFRLFGLTVRLETVAIAGAVLVGLILAGLSAGRLEARLRARAAAAALVEEFQPRLPGHKPESHRHDVPRLRRDDLLLFALGAVPGALVGGRLEYVLIHYDFYSTHSSLIADPSQGGLGLLGAVLFGTITVLAVARLLAAPIGLWLQVVSVPLLVAIGLGKLAMVLGGSGQGQFSTSNWATSYAHPGAWGSARPWRVGSCSARRPSSSSSP